MIVASGQSFGREAKPCTREIELDGLETVLRNPGKNPVYPDRLVGSGKYAQLHYSAPFALSTSTLFPDATECAIATIVLMRGDTIRDVGAAHRRARKNAVRKSLDLSAVEVAVRSKHSSRRSTVLVEELDVARLVEPGVIDLRRGTAILSVDLETFVPVHAHADCEIEVADRAAHEIHVDEPAVCSEALVEPRLHRSYRATEIAGQIDEMAAVGQHEIALLVRLRITPGRSTLLPLRANG